MLIKLWAVALVCVLVLSRGCRASDAADNADKSNLFDIRNKSFWKSLSTKLHISDTHFAIQKFSNERIVNSSLLRSLVLKEGYAQLDPLDWNLQLPDMVAIIEELHRRNIPIAFCFIYDEFWYLFMGLHRTIGNILGSEYKRLPDFWAWRVDPKNSERGWSVHRDKGPGTLYQNRMPKSLSVWIPLTDATTSNGCMYILPADRDPTYKTGNELDKHWRSISSDIRALPVKAGIVLGSKLIRESVLSVQASYDILRTHYGLICILNICKCIYIILLQ